MSKKFAKKITALLASQAYVKTIFKHTKLLLMLLQFVIILGSYAKTAKMANLRPKPK
jgi:hypothetical protein